MKIFRLLHVLVIVALLAACAPGGGAPLFPTSAPLPTPQVDVTSAPNINNTLSTYFDALLNSDYAGMYAMLSADSQAALSQEDFEARVKNAFNNMSLKDVTYTLISTNITPRTADVNYRVAYETYLIGTVERDITASFINEAGQWKLVWNDSIILPELTGGATLAMDYRLPERGEIFDREGLPIVTQTTITAIGLQPGLIGEEWEGQLQALLGRMTGQPAEAIAASYRFAQPEWYIPVGEVESTDPLLPVAQNFGGVITTEYTARFYHSGGVASNVIGYVLSVPAEELDAYKRRGYSGAELVGYSGIERWGEELLGGMRGGALYVVGADGSIQNKIGQSEPTQPSDLYLTLDRQLQEQAEDAMRGFNGAIVVLERDTGRVLAMVSSPGFDPNLFAAQNPNRSILPNVLADTNQPLFNRAAQGTYPLGSVFKIITMAAALESGFFTPETTYDCQYEFTELPDRVLYDWTYERSQRELRNTGEITTEPSGVLTLPEGLMRSCNPWFYHIGLQLFQQNNTTLVTDTARGFGLGQATGIGQVAEAVGNMPYPESALDATNFAIGQGTVEVTPLQVARFIAAIGNGGTLYRPQIVEQVVDANGTTTSVFRPEAQGVLPVKPENLTIIQEAMRMVVANQRGTAYNRMRGLSVPVYGKTGTAENVTGTTPHAWFAGYTDAAENTGLPDIAIAVLVEFQGEGSDYGAPIFRRVVESYYFGRPQTLYWFESDFGVTSTPTSPFTPTPEGGATNP